MSAQADNSGFDVQKKLKSYRTAMRITGIAAGAALFISAILAWVVFRRTELIFWAALAIAWVYVLVVLLQWKKFASSFPNTPEVKKEVFTAYAKTRRPEIMLRLAVSYLQQGEPEAGLKALEQTAPSKCSKKMKDYFVQLKDILLEACQGHEYDESQVALINKACFEKQKSQARGTFALMAVLLLILSGLCVTKGIENHTKHSRLYIEYTSSFVPYQNWDEDTYNVYQVKLEDNYPPLWKTGTVQASFSWSKVSDGQTSLEREDTISYQCSYVEGGKDYRAVYDELRMDDPARYGRIDLEQFILPVFDTAFILSSGDEELVFNCASQEKYYEEISSQAVEELLLWQLQLFNPAMYIDIDDEQRACYQKAYELAQRLEEIEPVSLPVIFETDTEGDVVRTIHVNIAPLFSVLCDEGQQPCNWGEYYMSWKITLV